MPSLTGPQADTMFHWYNGHLAVTQVSGAKRIENHFSDVLGFIIIHHHLDFDFGGIFDVRSPAIDFRLSLLRACTFDLEDGDARDFRPRQNFL